MRSCFVTFLCLLPYSSLAQVHYTYLWHLEQPIYWPAPDSSGLRYQRAWQSILAKKSGSPHPMDNIEAIFSNDDRVAAYQWRPRDSLATILGFAEAGVQLTYSGSLMENVESLAQVNQLGYGPFWYAAFAEARSWKTKQGTPRMDMVVFPFHHPLLPLVDSRVVRMEIALYKVLFEEIFGKGTVSKGFFPPEMAFSERLIPALVEAGIEWVIVSNSHISRACKDYPWVAGSGGDNISPPNPADQQNPPQGKYNRVFIDRGVSPANAYPFAYRPHYARYVNPATGIASKIVVVPAAQAESWKDGYSCYGLEEASLYAGSSGPEHPILVVLAHDGDNAFGGGYSYYMECVPALAQIAAQKGYVPTTIQGYLLDHPVDENDIVHVEDGAWVNADGDFGAPAFWNWNWPLMNSAGEVDPASGWSDDERNHAVIVAATNWVVTAEDVLGPPNLSQVLRPDSPGTTALERAWHYLLGAINSGYMYYGKALDMELKPVVASNKAIAWAKKALPEEFADKTPPTVFLPQHWPDNPGGTNFGPPYKYKVTEMPTETFFWTFAYDVSGIAGATLRYRLDEDGENPLWDDTNETYKGGDGVGPWKSLPMFRRDFPKGNVTGDPEFDTSILPQEIAELFWVRLTGLENVLIDWYVEVSDKNGNITRTEIQHLYIGSVSLGSVIWEPAYPDCDDVITVNHEKPGLLHWGINGWKMPPETLWPAGTTPFGDDKSVETPMTPCSKGYCVSLGPVFDFAYQVDFVFHHHDGTWDNNGGKDWHILISPCMQEFAGTDSSEAGGTMPFETPSAGESVSGEIVEEGMGLVGETEAENGVITSKDTELFRDYGDNGLLARVADKDGAEHSMARMGGGCSVGSQRPRSFWLMWVCGLLVGVRLRGRAC